MGVHTMLVHSMRRLSIWLIAMLLALGCGRAVAEALGAVASGDMGPGDVAGGVQDEVTAVHPDWSNGSMEWIRPKRSTGSCRSIWSDTGASFTASSANGARHD